jgi:hypothetical protein
MREPTDSIIAFQAFLFPFQEIGISQEQRSIYLNCTITMKYHFGKFARVRQAIALISVCVSNCLPKWNGNFGFGTRLGRFPKKNGLFDAISKSPPPVL